MVTRTVLLFVATLAVLIGVSRYLKGTEAAFTAATIVGGNTFQVDAVDKHFAAVPGSSTRTDTGAPVATGTVDTMRIDLGTVSQPSTYSAVASVSNPTADPQPATLTLNGVQQVDQAVFASTGTTRATIPAGGTDQIIVRTSAATAGHGSGEIRLGVAGSDSWEYQAWPVVLDAAPAAPSGLTASAGSGGSIRLSWSASPTQNIASYNVYRSLDGGQSMLVNQTPLTDTSLSDTPPTDGTYTYTVRAAISAPPLESLSSNSASATSDRTPPALTNLVYVDAKKSADAITGHSEAGANLTITDNGGNTWTLTVPSNGDFTQTVTEIDGNPGSKATPVSFTITATDPAGNATLQTLSDTDTR